MSARKTIRVHFGTLGNESEVVHKKALTEIARPHFTHDLQKSVDAAEQNRENRRKSSEIWREVLKNDIQFLFKNGRAPEIFMLGELATPAR